MKPMNTDAWDLDPDEQFACELAMKYLSHSECTVDFAVMRAFEVIRRVRKEMAAAKEVWPTKP